MISKLAKYLLEELEAVRYGEVLKSFTDLPQYPEMHGFWVLPDGSFIIVDSMYGECSHNSIAKRKLEAEGYGSGGDPYMVIDEFRWCRCVVDAGDFYCDPPEPDQWSRKSRSTCKDIAVMYDLKMYVEKL